MLIYLLNIIFVYSLLIASKRVKSKAGKKILIFFSFTAMVLVAGIRYNVGTDFLMYEKFFFKIHRISLFSKSFEFAFILLCKVIRLFSNNSVYLFIAIAIWIYYFIYTISIRNCRLYDLAIFLFVAFGFFTSSLNILRQWMSIVLLFKAFELFANNKKIGLLFIVLAILSHYTILYCIPLFLIIYFLKRNGIRITIIAIGLCMYPFITKMFTILGKIIIYLGLNQKYIKYFSGSNIINTSIFVMPLFTLITYVLYYLFLRNKIYTDKKQENFDRFMVNFTVIGFIVSIFGTRVHLFQRLQYYFCPAIIFIIPKIVENMKKENNRKIALIFCTIMGMVFYIYSLKQNGGEPLPYQTIFSENIEKLDFEKTKDLPID